MLYDGYVNCGADILSEDISDESDKYKYYEEIANDEDLQRSVGGEELGVIRQNLAKTVMITIKT